ncbi:MAG TPA: aldolase/citrate lyase family protein [Actinomycetota bacterium]|nr:aldolase/citrate lyase family protein [Actinomycetota bacterium]
MRPNSTKARLRAGECVYGCFMRYPEPGLAELVALQGFDFLVFDGEHGTLEPRECENMVRAAEIRSVTPLVRVPDNRPSVILRFLDTGAQGVHIPLAASAEDAASAVRAVKYWPSGDRGLTAVRAASYGEDGSLADYVARANEETLVVVQIETPGAVEGVEDIARTDGVDVVFVGPTDLSHAFGVPGQTSHPLVTEAYERIADGVAGSTAALGILVADEEAAAEWRRRGARYIAVTVDSLVRRSARTLLGALREGSSG